MLAIRMQRSGRKGHAMFRVVVQDSRRTPTSGKLVAQLGSYDPHAKTIIVDKEKAQFYLDNGAQPSESVARLLKNEGVKLPGWVEVPVTKQRTVRNADKRRSTRPEAPAEEAPVEQPEAAPQSEPEAPAEADTSDTAEAAAPAVEETAEEKPAEDAKEEVAEEATEAAAETSEPTEEKTPEEAPIAAEEKTEKSE
jgi:small subunit ribosomal protein S16